MENFQNLVFLDCTVCIENFNFSVIQQEYCAELFQVKVVQCPNNDDFPGLYCADLIGNPWLADSSILFLSSVWRSQEVILAVDIERSVQSSDSSRVDS